MYHTSAWRRFLTEVFGAELIVLAAFEAGELVGLLPVAAQRRWNGRWRLASLPFSHHVPALGIRPVANALVEAAAALGWRRYRCDLELRGTVEYDVVSVVTTRVTIAGGPEAMRRRIDRKTRNQLVQAEQQARVTLRPAGPDDAAEVDTIMAVNRRHLGSATYPPGTLARLQRLAGRAVDVTLACVEHRPVAFMVTSSVGRVGIYHYGASLPAFRSCRPNNLLMWHSLCWAASQGATTLDLGTSLPTQRGLIHFKEGWGGRSEPLAYVRRDRDGRTFPKPMLQTGPAARVAAWGVRHLPLPVFRRVTPWLLKELG